MEKCHREVMWRSAVLKCCREVRAVKKCCREVLWRSVVKEGVL